MGVIRVRPILLYHGKPANELLWLSWTGVGGIFQEGLRTVRKYVKISLNIGLTQQVLKDSYMFIVRLRAIASYLLGVIDPNVLTNNSLTYLRTVCPCVRRRLCWYYGRLLGRHLMNRGFPLIFISGESAGKK